MSKESFAAVIFGVGILFFIVVSMWFSPNSILRPKFPQRQIVNTKVNQQNVSSDQAGSDQVTADISAVEYKFSQTVINAKVDQKIVVTLHNDGAMVHDFTVEIGSNKYATKILEPGMAETIEFTVDKTGEYDFYCSVAEHREEGMEGKLIVK